MRRESTITGRWQALKARNPKDDQGFSPIETVVVCSLLLAVALVALAMLQSYLSVGIVISVLGAGGLVLLLALGLAKR